MLRVICTAFLLTLQLSVCYGQRSISISSPNRVIRLTVSTDERGSLTYQVHYKSVGILAPSMLGFKLSKPQLQLTNFAITGIDSATVDHTWKPVWGEVSEIRDNHKELAVQVQDQSGSTIQVLVRFRVFDDGIGFRYEFPQQPTLSHFVVDDELTQFTLTGDHKTFWIPGDYDTNEYLYNTTPLSQIDALTAAKKEKDIALQSLIGPDAIQTPLLMKTAGGIHQLARGRASQLSGYAIAGQQSRFAATIAVGARCRWQ